MELRLRRAALLALGLAGVLGVAGARGSQPVAPFRADAESRLAGPVADAVQRLAMLDLRLRNRALPEDYAVTADLLGFARRLAPRDAELERRIAAACFAAGDEAGLIASTRRLVRLDPADTVAQLRLITHLIASKQTVEQRLAAYERYLGAEGERIDPSVRSRLALDAALLSRERGDAARFKTYLARATELDGTNKDAFAVALRAYEEGGGDAQGLLTLHAMLLYADPLDPHVHRSMARSLAGEGAYDQALRMTSNALEIMLTYGNPPPELERERMALLAVDDNPRVVLDEIELFRARIKHRAEFDRTQAQEAGEPEADWPDPEDARLPLPFERMRVVLADALGESEIVRSSLDEMEATVIEALRALAEELQSEPVRAREQILADYLTQFMTLQGARALTGVDVARLTSDFEQARRQLPVMETAARMLDPWLAVHEGRHEEALRLAEAIDDPGASTLVRGVALERLGRLEEAVVAYQTAARAAPTDPPGVWAALRVIDLAGQSALITQAGQEMDAFVRKIPEWLDRMIRQPSTYMSLRAEASSETYAADEPAVVRVILRNMAPIPLALGADRVLNSRMLLSPAIDDSIRGFVGTPQPDVLDVDRRLRLMPREALTVEFPADLGFTGYLLDINARLTIRQRWRVLQAFQIGRLGAIVAGPMALTAETGAVRRLSLPEARLTPGELAERLGRDDPVTLPRTLGGIRAVLQGPGAGVGSDPGEIQRLVRALIARYDRAGPVERALMLAELPHARQVPAMAAFDAHARESIQGPGVRDGEGLVAALVVMTRVTNREDPALAAAAISGLPALDSLAQGLAQRLAPGEQAYARLGPDVNELSGPTPGAPRRADADTP